jgi:hypothetical protein
MYARIYQQIAFENHGCDDGVKNKQIAYNNSTRLLKDLAHYLKPSFSKGSIGEIEDVRKNFEEQWLQQDVEPYKLEQAEERMNAKIDRFKHPRYITYDFETDTHDGIHKPNHVEVDIMKIDEGQTHEYDKCLIDKINFNGYDCAERFCDWLFTKENSNSTVMAHNGSGYYNQFILKYCIGKGLLPSKLIRQGSRITYMSFLKYSIRFVDSYLFMSQPLKDLSKTYEIDTLKGYFPHYFNTPENQDYIGPIPDSKMFSPENMSVSANEEFYIWYSKQANITDFIF